MDLDGAHPGSSRAAQSMICGYRIVYVYSVIYFSSGNIVFWNTPQLIYLRSIDCYYLLGFLTTPWKKSFNVVHQIFLAASQTVTTERIFLLYRYLHSLLENL